MNGMGWILVVNFTEVMTDQLKIRQTGPNWEGNQYFNIKTIKFLSLDPGYPNGIFRSLFTQHRANMHQSIRIRARDFDLEEFHKPDNRTVACSSGEDKYWVQIELVDAKFMTSCYCLKHCSNCQFRSSSLRGSNDAMLPLDQWTVLDQRRARRESQFNNFASFGCFGGAFRYFRFVVEGPGWDGSSRLFLKHIHLYGYLISTV
jgi:hypothetical protein